MALSYEWTENEYWEYRKVPDEIRDAGYPHMEVMDDRGIVFQPKNQSDHVMCFIGPGCMMRYRLHPQYNLNLENA